MPLSHREQAGTQLVGATVDAPTTDMAYLDTVRRAQLVDAPRVCARGWG